MIYALAIAIQIISSPTNAQNTEFWIKTLQANSVDLKLNAIQRLQELKDPNSIESIQRLLGDADPELRSAAARALGRFPFETALRALEGALAGEKDSYVKSEINRSIKGLKTTFKKQEEKAKGIKSSTPAESPDSEDIENSGE